MSRAFIFEISITLVYHKAIIYADSIDQIYDKFVCEWSVQHDDNYNNESKVMKAFIYAVDTVIDCCQSAPIVDIEFTKWMFERDFQNVIIKLEEVTDIVIL